MTTRYRIVEHVSLALILAMGAGLAWFCLGGLLTEIVAAGLRSPRSSVGGSEALVMLGDGVPAIQTKSHFGAYAVDYRTIDGKVVGSDERPVTVLESSCRLPGPLRRRMPEMSWYQRVVPLGSAQDTIWFFLHDGRRDGRGYFLGYDAETRLRVGCIGRRGFRPDEPPADERFAVDGRAVSDQRAIARVSRPAVAPAWDTAEPIWNNSLYLTTQDGIVLVDLAARTARVAWAGDDFISAASMNGLLVVREAEWLRILQPDGKERHAFPLPSSLRGDVAIQLFGLPGKKIVLHDDSALPVPHPPRDTFWIAADGTIARHEKIAVRKWTTPTMLSPTLRNVIMSLIVLPSPPGVLAWMGLEISRSDDPAAWQTLWPQWWPAVLITVILSAGLAVVTYRHALGSAVPWPGAWATFVALGGVPAFIAYLVHREWPALLPCPRCGRSVPRDRPTCTACTGEFPAADPLGIEVFA